MLALAEKQHIEMYKHNFNWNIQIAHKSAACSKEAHTDVWNVYDFN